KIRFMEPTTVLANLQLEIHQGYRIQIDTLLITPSSLTILEVKNVAGKLTYVPNPPHFECTYENRSSLVMDCPLRQLQNHSHGLEQWLAQRGFTVPVQGLIVLASSKTSVQNAPSEMPLIYAKHLPHYFHSQPSKAPCLTESQQIDLIHRLKSEQYPYRPFPLSHYYSVDEYLLKKGLVCH